MWFLGNMIGGKLSGHGRGVVKQLHGEADLMRLGGSRGCAWRTSGGRASVHPNLALHPRPKSILESWVSLFWCGGTSN